MSSERAAPRGRRSELWRQQISRAASSAASYLRVAGGGRWWRSRSRRRRRVLAESGHRAAIWASQPAGRAARPASGAPVQLGAANCGRLSSRVRVRGGAGNARAPQPPRRGRRRVRQPPPRQIVTSDNKANARATCNNTTHCNGAASGSWGCCAESGRLLRARGAHERTNWDAPAPPPRTRRGQTPATRPAVLARSLAGRARARSVASSRALCRRLRRASSPGGGGGAVGLLAAAAGSRARRPKLARGWAGRPTTTTIRRRPLFLARRRTRAETSARAGSPQQQSESGSGARLRRTSEERRRRRRTSERHICALPLLPASRARARVCARDDVVGAALAQAQAGNALTRSLANRQTLPRALVVASFASVAAPSRVALSLSALCASAARRRAQQR